MPNTLPPLEPTVLDTGSVDRMILRKFLDLDPLVARNITVKNTLTANKFSLSGSLIEIIEVPLAPMSDVRMFSSSELNQALAVRGVYEPGDMLFNADNGDVYYWVNNTWRLDGEMTAWSILRYPRTIVSVTGAKYSITEDSITPL